MADSQDGPGGSSQGIAALTWTVVRRKQVEPADLYELARQHKLLPVDIAAAVNTFQGVARIVHWHDLFAVDELAGHLLLTVAEGDVASLDFVPIPSFFAGDAYKTEFIAAVVPLLMSVFDVYRVRRIGARVPERRGRTKKALKALGFRFEGKEIEGVQYFGADPENVISLGLLPGYLTEV